MQSTDKQVRQSDRTHSGVLKSIRSTEISTVLKMCFDNPGIINAHYNSYVGVAEGTMADWKVCQQVRLTDQELSDLGKKEL